MPESLPAVDRLSVTTVVDNSSTTCAPDEKIARRFTHVRARKMPTSALEHGLAHWVEIGRGRRRRPSLRLGADGRQLLPQCPRARPGPVARRCARALARTSGSLRWTGWLPRDLPAFDEARPGLHGGADHFLPRYNERAGERVYIGQLRRE